MSFPFNSRYLQALPQDSLKCRLKSKSQKSFLKMEQDCVFHVFRNDKFEISISHFPRRDRNNISCRLWSKLNSEHFIVHKIIQSRDSFFFFCGKNLQSFTDIKQRCPLFDSSDPSQLTSKSFFFAEKCWKFLVSLLCCVHFTSFPSCVTFSASSCRHIVLFFIEFFSLRDEFWDELQRSHEARPSLISKYTTNYWFIIEKFF